MALKLNESLPKFHLLGIEENGKEKHFTNEDFLGKMLVMYFYPKDDTPGCTKESCAFNDLLAKIKQHANIVGISADSVDSHKKFQSKYKLSFPLLSDPNLNLASALEATKDGLLGGTKIARSTFLVNSSGTLLQSWYNVKVDGHDEEVLQELNKELNTKL